MSARRAGTSIRAPTVVVTGSVLGDRLAELLADRGCRVVRGDPPRPPERAPVVPPEAWPSTLSDADVVVVGPDDTCPRELLLAAPVLRGVVSMVIGVDTIDVDAAHELGLVIGHGAMAENYLGVSESTVMLITVLLLQLHAKQRLLREGWAMSGGMLGNMVRGKTIGLIGLGRSARGVVERLAGWDVTVQAYDPYVAAEDAPSGVRLVTLDTLLTSSDVVSVHVTLTEETRHLLGAPQLRRMQPHAYLVNTARGAVVDETALIEALEQDAIAGAALDVFETEPLPEASPLRRMDNVVLTPHTVGHTQELWDAVPRAACDNVLRILRGEPPLHLKSPASQLDAWQQRLDRLDAG